MSLEDFLTISRLTTLSAFLIFLLFYSRKRLWNTEFRWIGILLMGSVGFDVLSQIFYLLKIGSNVGVNSWIVFEFVISSLLYLSFFKRKRIRIIILIISSFLTLFGLFDFFYLEGPTVINSYMRSLACIVIAGYSIYFFFQLLIDLPATKLTEFPMFWISAGMLLYFSGTFILNISIRYLVGTLNSNLIFFWIFLLGLNFVKNILFGIGSYYKLKSIPTV